MRQKSIRNHTCSDFKINLRMDDPSSSHGAEGDKPLDLDAIPEEIFLKLLVLGDLGVGKTALIRQYTGGTSSTPDVNAERHSSGYKVSIDSGYTLKQVEVDGRKIHLQLWDIAGHERFGGMTKIYYKYAHGAILVFDLSRPETFESALSWLADVTEKLFDERQKTEEQDLESPQSLSEANKAMPVVLLANKCDLPDLKVPRQKYSSYVAENGLLGWFETSVKDHSNISLAVRRLVEYILENDVSVKVAKENAKLWKDLPRQ